LKLGKNGGGVMRKLDLAYKAMSYHLLASPKAISYHHHLQPEKTINYWREVMKEIIVLCIFTCAFVAVSAFAQQNKVVVVPMANKSAAGDDKQIQFNDGGPTAGAANFYYDKATGFIGINNSAPTIEMELVQTSAFDNQPSGFGLNWSGNIWKIFHSGSHFSFANNGVRLAYVSSGTGNYVTTSSREAKTNIAKLTSVLDRAMQLNPVSYHYRNDTSATQAFGFIAEDVAPLFPELVSYDEQGSPGLSYAGFGPVAIGAIQEQQQQIKQLQQENEILKNKIAQIEKMLNL
jgi:hypothetical protein